MEDSHLCLKPSFNVWACWTFPRPVICLIEAVLLTGGCSAFCDKMHGSPLWEDSFLVSQLLKVVANSGSYYFRPYRLSSLLHCRGFVCAELLNRGILSSKCLRGILFLLPCK